MVVLGIDPGTTSVGYSILEGGEGKCHFRAADLIHITSKETGARMQELSSGINSVIQKWKPETLAVERLFFAKNQKTALAVAEARGVILLTASLANLMVYEYTPLEIKKTVTGYGGADKAGLQKMIRLTFPETAALRAQDDVFDAMAVALTCYLKEGGPKKFQSRPPA